MCFSSMPAKWYHGAGLKDIFIEAEAVAAGSIAKVFEGQHWNCGIRAHKLGADAFVTRTILNLVWLFWYRRAPSKICEICKSEINWALTFESLK